MSTINSLYPTDLTTLINNQKRITMTYHYQPATEALDRPMHYTLPRRVSSLDSQVSGSSESLKFDLTALFQAATDLHQDSLPFPVIAWCSDDESEASTVHQYHKANNSSESSSSDTKVDDKTSTNLESSHQHCRVVRKGKPPMKRRRLGPHKKHHMVRSKSLYSDLYLLSLR